MRLARSKYGNRRVRIDNLTFDSQAEARRYQELKLLWKAEKIFHLNVHSRWPLLVNGIKIGDYESDFDYFQDGKLHVEDVKGVKTELYRWKKKHAAAQGLEIREIRA